MRNVVAKSRFNRERDFKNNLVNWLGHSLGVGPTLGKIFFLAVPGGQYEANLKDFGVSSDKIFSSIHEAHDAMVSGRNDVLCVAPETFTVTQEVDWTKSSCHALGLGGPQNSGFDVGTIITTVTGTVGAVIHNTGTRNQFHNLTITNQGAAATALTAFNNAGPGTIIKGSQLVGMLGATACDTALASSLQISANGYYLVVEDTIIGTTDGQVQGSDTNAQIYYAANAMVSDNLFRRCLVQSQIAAATRVLVYIAANGCDRQQIFDDCTFYAFAVNHTVAMNQALKDSNASTHDVMFKNCAGINIVDWVTDTNNMVWSSSADAGTAGGIGVLQT